MAPLSGRVRPAIRRSSVLLPAPLGPTIAVTPGPKTRSTSSVISRSLLLAVIDSAVDEGSGLVWLFTEQAYQQRDDQADQDQHYRERDRAIQVAAFQREVDRQRHGLRDAHQVAREHDRGAE